MTVYGNGEQTRDFVYAGDVAAAIKAGLAVKGYQTINVSTEHETSVNKLLGAFAEVAADKLEVRYAETRQGDIFRSALSNARLKEILAVTPQMQFIRRAGYGPVSPYFRICRFSELVYSPVGATAHACSGAQ